MEKIITIGDKEVKLKANAKQALIYRANFGKDIMEVQSGLFKMLKFNDNGKPVFGLDGIDCLDSVGIVQIIWTLAKAADDSIPPLEEWLDQFDTFPIIDILGVAYELVLANLVSTTTIKNPKAAANSRRKG